MGWFGSDKKQAEPHWKTKIVSKHPYEDVKIEIQSESMNISRSIAPLTPETRYVHFFRDGEYCRIKEDLISKLEGPPDPIPLTRTIKVNINDSIINRSKLNFEGDNRSNLDFKEKDTLVSKDKESVFSEIIGSTDITMDDEFLYFIYADGFLARVPKPRNTDELCPILLELSQRERLSIMLTHYGSKYSNFIKNDFNDYLKKTQDEKERKEREKKIERERKEQERMKIKKNIERMKEQENKKRLITRAEDYVEHLDYDRAITIYEEMGDKKAAKRVRKLKADLAAPKTEIHGDQITKTKIKDSVVSKSNVGAGGKSKAEELRDAKALLDDGIIDDAEFKQMKKEILGK